MADKGYDGDDILQTIAVMNAVPVIPSRSHRRRQRDYDHTIYKHKNIVERTFNNLKNWRKAGIREKIFNVLSEDPHNEYIMIDSTIVRTHQQAGCGKEDAA